MPLVRISAQSLCRPRSGSNTALNELPLMMQARTRLFKSAVTITFTVRRSQLLARWTYELWEIGWRVFLWMRRRLAGDSAEFAIEDLRIRMYLDDPTVTRTLYVFGEYEIIETRCLLRLLNGGGAFVDVGANTGYYSLVAGTALPSPSRIFAFEPCSENYALLERNIQLNNLQNVQTQQVAISDKSGTFSLYKSRINKGDHRIYDGRDDSIYNLGQPRTSELVPMMRLDDHRELQAMKVGVIKMDIQGAEHAAVRGMTTLLTKNRNVVLMTEYWPHGLERSGTSPTLFLKELKVLGLEPYEISADGTLERRKAAQLLAQVSGLKATTLFFSRKSFAP